MKNLGTALFLLAVVALLCSVGCTYPTYFKEVRANYDAQGNVVGKSVILSVTQTDPIAHPLIVEKDLNPSIK